MKHQKLSIVGLVFLIATISTNVAVLPAQTGQGQIVGTVTDPTAAVIPGVTVATKNVDTGVARSTVTNEEGLFRVPYLNPGFYEVSFEADGFRRLLYNNVQVRSTETTRVNASLEVGAVAESVEVSAAADLLETETSTTGHLISGITLNRIPSPQQRVQTILFRMPGVTSQGGFGHVAGQRARAFNATMDGVSGMEPVRGEVATDRFLNTVTENMAEVKILTTVLPAEYGHSGGGVMNVTYKSGTNQLHGVAQERYRHKDMLHRAWQEPKVTANDVSYHFLTGTLSGPVALPGIYNGRNKTFWLFGFQRHMERSSENNDRNVPSPEMLAGDFSFPQQIANGGRVDPIHDPYSLTQLPDGKYSRTPLPNNMVPQSRFDPVAKNFLALNPYVAPDNRNNQMFFNSQGPQNNLSADTVYRSYRTGFDYKIDHSFSDSHKLFGRYSNYRHRSFAGRWQVQFANRDFDYFYAPIPTDQHQLALSDSITINPTTINEFRIGANRRKFTRSPQSLNADWGTQLGIPNVNPETLPGFRDSGGGHLFGARFQEGLESDVTENISLQNNLTMVRGRHTFKMGYELLRTRANAKIMSQPSGVYRFGGTELPFTPNTGHPFASFLMGGVVRADFTSDRAAWLPRWWTNSLYFQTDWKATQKLTLNLGVRWQYETPYDTKYGQQTQFDFTAIDPLTGRQGALLHPTTPLASSDLNNFQPRIGLAYNFHSKWVFRAGVALNTLDIWTTGLRENFEEYFATAVVQPAPGNPDVAFRISQGPPPIQFNVASDGTVPFVGTNYSGRSASLYDPNMRAPYVMNWSGGFQYHLSGSSVIELTYQGSAGVGLLNRWDINAIPLNIRSTFDELDRVRRSAQNFKPWPHFGNIFHYGNYGHNSFHSGTFKFDKRYSHGLAFTSFYSWGKAIDEASGDGAAGGVTYYNRRLEKARSDYDVAHRWVTFATYELPVGRGRRFLTDTGGVVNGVLGGWELAVIQTLETGAPFGFTHTGSSNVYLPMTQRPNMAAGKTYDDIKLDWDRRGPCRHQVACAEPWADINVFAYPGSFTPGQVGRNIVNAPGVLWHELSASKKFDLNERVKFTLRLDYNSPFKRPFFSRPGSVVDFRNPQNFGKITGTQGVTSGLGASKPFMEIHFRLEF